jgi:hypothetical protein
MIGSIRYRYNGTKWVDDNNITVNTLREGTTLERPTTVPDGFVYRDTTLNKLIWSIGGKYYDNTGLEV